jgi:hypothetical protein
MKTFTAVSARRLSGYALPRLGPATLLACIAKCGPAWGRPYDSALLGGCGFISSDGAPGLPSPHPCPAGNHAREPQAARPLDLSVSYSLP